MIYGKTRIMASLCRVIIAGLWLMVCSADAAVQAVLHVAPYGDDDAPGTAQYPLASLAGARDAVRPLLSGGLTGHVEVVFRPGEYGVDTPVTLGAEDSGNNGYRVIYRSAAGLDSVRFVGGAALTNWTDHGNGIWAHTEIDWPAFSLYENGRRAVVARTPNRPPVSDPDYLKTFAPYYHSVSGTHSTLVYDPDDFDPATWTIGPDARVTYWNHADDQSKRRDWGMTERELLSVDADSNTLNLNDIGETEATRIGAGDRYFVKGMYALLDQPGEFFHDSMANTLYYYPRHGDPNQNDIRAPSLMTLITVGESPHDLAQNITFRELTFGYTRRPGNGAMGTLQIRDAQGIDVKSCRFSNVGSFAIFGFAVMTNCVVRDTLIEHAGMGGIFLYNPYQRTVYPDYINAHNRITNCLIHDLGEEYVSDVHNGGVLLWCVNNCTVSHCEIFANPRYAVSLRGHYSTQNDPHDSGAHYSYSNEFSYLKLYRVGTDSGDMGAVHAAHINEPDGSFMNTWKQITVRNVYAHDSMLDEPPDGIFMDHPYSAEGQRFQDIDIARIQGNAYRGNRNTNQTFINCSWIAGFDPAAMAYDRIGLLPEFPYPSTVSYWQFDSGDDNQTDVIRANDLKTIASGTSALYARNRIPNPEAWPFEDGTDAAENGASLYDPILDGGILDAVAMTDWASWTLECWFQVDDIAGEDMFLAGNRHGAPFAPDDDYVGWHIMMHPSGTLTFLADDGPSLATVQSENSFGDGDWHHLAVIWDHDATATGELRLFVDGKSEGAAVGLGGLSQNNKFALGAREIGGAGILNDNRWRGRLDECRLSKSALTPDRFLNAENDSAPWIANARATAVTNVSAYLSAEVQGGRVPCSANVYWGVQDKATNDDQWANVAQGGVWTDAWAFVGLAVTNLIPGVRYRYAFSADSGTNRVWMQPSGSFVTSRDGVGATAQGTPYWWYEKYGVTNEQDLVDISDRDEDGMDGWQEFRAGTDPTDPHSVFKVIAVSREAETNTITWLGKGGCEGEFPWGMYATTNVSAPREWQMLASNIMSSGGNSATNTWSHAPIPDGSVLFYRPAVVWPIP